MYPVILGPSHDYFAQASLNSFHSDHRLRHSQEPSSSYFDQPSGEFSSKGPVVSYLKQWLLISRIVILIRIVGILINN